MPVLAARAASVKTTLRPTTTVRRVPAPNTYAPRAHPLQGAPLRTRTAEAITEATAQALQAAATTEATPLLREARLPAATIGAAHRQVQAAAQVAATVAEAAVQALRATAQVQAAIAQAVEAVAVAAVAEEDNYRSDNGLKE